MISAEWLPDAALGPVLRLSGDGDAVAALRAAFDRLAAGQSEATFEFVDQQQVSIEFQAGKRGGLRRTSQGRFVFAGTLDQWETRARLLDPLTQEPAGFQYLDDGNFSEIAVVVTTYPDRSF
jgi:hypothetical protein